MCKQEIEVTMTETNIPNQEEMLIEETVQA